MSDRILEVMPHIYKWEGGYVDHPRDPGGATNMGITIGTLRAWRGSDVTKEDVRNLTQEEANEIYKKNYWDKAYCDYLPKPLDYVVMDMAVHSGPRTAVLMLQRLLGVEADGIIGPKTLAAVASYKGGVTKLCNDLLDRRERFLRRQDTWPTFGRGWLNRLNYIREVIRRG